jgi:hypothetical protein
VNNYFDIPKQARGKPMQFIEAYVGKVNPRTEVHGPDRKLGLDINIEADISVDIMKKLAIGDGEQYAEFLFDDEGKLKHPELKLITLDREFENYYMYISFSAIATEKDAQRFLVDRICKFSFVPKMGKIISLSFQIQFHPFEEIDIGRLVKSGHERQSCYLRFEHSQDDIEAGGDKDE